MSLAVATRTAVELLHVQPETTRARSALLGLSRTASSVGLDLTTSPRYTGRSSWLVLWGPGAPDRAALLRQHVQAGGHVIALDLAYWHRDQKVRISIDAPHPQAWVLRQSWSPHRWASDPAPVSDRWNPRGPVVLAGIGHKAHVQYGDAVDRWEAAMRRACVDRGWTVIVRDKGATVPIDRALVGASLVLTWHSNVAVDAIRLGIPVVCRDGAAAAACPSEIPDEPQPLSKATRDRFLANLAWFQWTLTDRPSNEGLACWRWLMETLA